MTVNGPSTGLNAHGWAVLDDFDLSNSRKAGVYAVTLFRGFSLTLAFLLFSGTAFSQTFNALFDGYYAFNLNKPSNQLNAGSFDFKHQQFSFELCRTVPGTEAESVGYRFDFGFGDAATIVAMQPSQPGIFIGTSSRRTCLSSKNDLTLDFGKFVTPLGAEVIETKDNWNYSRGLLFTYAVPFYHFGVLPGLTSEKTTLAAYVTNGLNNVQDNNRGKRLLLDGNGEADR